jgi:hypothetical protein
MIRLTQFFLAACVVYFYGVAYGIAFLLLSPMLAWLLFFVGKKALGEETISGGYFPLTMRLINWGLCFSLIVFGILGHPVLENFNHAINAMVPDLDSLAIK